MNLVHTIYNFNIKNILADTESVNLLTADQRKKMKISILPIDDIIEPIEVLTSLKSHYDLVLVNEKSFETLSFFFHRCLFIFVQSKEKKIYSFLDKFYQKIHCYEGLLYRNDFTSICFQSDRISISDQVFKRDKPYRFLKKATELLLNNPGKQTIVEVGTARFKLTHDLDIINPECCNCGHSTNFWCRMDNVKVHSVDINVSSNLMPSLGNNSKLNLYTNDGLQFLEDYANREKTSKIDLIYLDAWDVIPDTNYSESHLQAYEIIKNKLKETCIILVDDTDVAFDYETGFCGKGSLLIPKLLSDGYKLIYCGRQSLLVKINF